MSEHCNQDAMFIADCQKIGLSSEQIFQLWTLKLEQEKSIQKQAELKLQIELCKLQNTPSEQDEGNSKKRKINEITHDDGSDLKQIKYGYANSEYLFSDDILGLIFEFLNYDFEVFKYLGVSKQFHRNIIEKTKHLTILSEKKELPPYDLTNVHTLAILNESFDINFHMKLIFKCVNILNLYIERIDFQANESYNNTVYFEFKKPTIERIVINFTKNNILLSNENLYNLKIFEVLESFTWYLGSVLNNYTDSLKSLTLTNTNFSDVSPIVRLPLLQRLELELIDQNQLYTILNNVRNLEILKVKVDYVLPATLIEPVTESLNLKFFKLEGNIIHPLPNLLSEKLWKYNFSNLKVLQINDAKFEAVGWKLFSANNTFTNLESFDYSNSSGVVPFDLSTCESLTNLKHISFRLIFCPHFDYGCFQKSIFKNLKSISIYGDIALINNLDQIEVCKNLEVLSVVIDNEANLINLVKSNAFQKLTHLGVSYSNPFPEDFFKYLNINFKQLVSLDCFFSHYHDIELLREYCPENLKEFSISERMSSLGKKLLSAWKKLKWNYKDTFECCFQLGSSYFGIQLEKEENSLLQKILNDNSQL